jgi:hypothetical protein
MSKHKIIHLALLFIMIFSLLYGETNHSVSAMPMNSTDESKVPHYFGPYPNWANSPFTVADVAVEIIGNGTGATATATVGANGAVTGITITDPGEGYAWAVVNITGGGTGAAANAVVTTSGVVSAITVDTPGSGYTQPTVAISGGGVPGTPASIAPSVATDTYNVNVGSATGGTFTLSVDAATTGSIAWNALAADVQSALLAAGVSASVTGSGSIADPWAITFALAPAAVTLDPAGLTQPGLVPVTDAGVAAAATHTYSATIGSASGGTF